MGHWQSKGSLLQPDQKYCILSFFPRYLPLAIIDFVSCYAHSQQGTNASNLEDLEATDIRYELLPVLLESTSIGLHWA
jgi:hypothetical protein